MKTTRYSSGFALMLVLWTLVVLSAIALTLAASVGVEVRASQDSWEDLQAERLAKSGHEIATYLETRSLGTAAEDLTGLPVETVIAGFTYRVTLDAGTIDLILEGENRKLDLASADEQAMTNFFTAWTGDAERSREIVDSIADWKDPDDDPHPMGAESGWYSGRGYLPRNGPLGAADLFLIRGLTPADFAPAIIEAKNAPAVRRPLSSFISAVPTGIAVNPNYASRLVLQSVAGMTPELLDAIFEMRQESVFASPDDFRKRTGLAADSPLMSHFVFDRGRTPAILAIARLHNSMRIRTERRARMQIPQRRGAAVRFVGLIERNSPME